MPRLGLGTWLSTGAECTALVLATVASKTYIGDRLPVCNYPTWLDKYILLCLAIFGCLALENAAVFLIDKKYGRSSTHEDMEDTVGLVCVGAWIIGHMTHLLRQPAHRTQAEAEGKLEYTHFISVPLAHDDKFRRTVDEFREDVVMQRFEGIDASIFMPSRHHPSLNNVFNGGVT